jgi:hypothetical protein
MIPVFRHVHVIVREPGGGRYAHPQMPPRERRAKSSSLADSRVNGFGASSVDLSQAAYRRTRRGRIGMRCMNRAHAGEPGGDGRPAPLPNPSRRHQTVRKLNSSALTSAGRLGATNAWGSAAAGRCCGAFRRQMAGMPDGKFKLTTCYAWHRPFRKDRTQRDHGCIKGSVRTECVARRTEQTGGCRNIGNLREGARPCRNVDFVGDSTNTGSSQLL